MEDLPADFKVRQGAKIRAIANDIKRDGAALAAELGEDEKTISDLFSGNVTAEVFDRVIAVMVRVYPVSRVDLEVKRDDTDNGAVIWPPERALASSRVFTRENATGSQTPFYEYRDTAMSTVGPYRPEWIKTLRVVASSNPEDPEVAYNNGHLMHQMTFFVGSVNFYWKDGNRAHLAEMNTGDSNYITPFVPHSYTSRNGGEEAYIVAVTFEGKLAHIQDELSLLDPERVKQELLDLSDRNRTCGSILRRELANRMLPLDKLGESSEIPTSRLEAILNGEDFPSMGELSRISNSLTVNVRDLLPPDSIDPGEVVVKHSSPDAPRHFPSEECPSYRVADLAASRNVPFARGMAVRVLDGMAGEAETVLDLVAPAHEYAYNYGNETAVLQWEGESGPQEAVFHPGGSYYLKPGIPHALRNQNPERPSDILVMRVGASFHGDAHLELSNIPREALHRVLSESRQWYDSSSRNA